ncbi:MAG: hypothetical protein ACE1Z6_07085 [Candidatus Methylomirabilales bacterium]
MAQFGALDRIGGVGRIEVLEFYHHTYFQRMAELVYIVSTHL